MKEHLKRKKEIFKGAIPPEGTPEYNELKEKYEHWFYNTPALKKEGKRRFEKARNTLIVQNANGINLSIDEEIRHFLREFNVRTWEHGIRSMPIMFNIMEAFFNYDKSIIYFELLEEEDYLISFYDFLDFYTSNEFVGDIETIKENLETDLIYNYNVGADIGEIIFKTSEGHEFVIGGISLIRRNNEVTILFLTGQIIDTDKITEDLSGKLIETIPGKENIVADKTLKLEAVKLNGNPNYWKILIACRFDLENQTIDARYIAKDVGQGFQITTDEIYGFLNSDGKFIKPDLEASYKNQIIRIEKYNSIFELAKAVLYLPYYFNIFENDILDEDHQTGYKGLIKSAIERKKFSNVDGKFKTLSRSLWILNRKNKFNSDQLKIFDNNFRIETTGYWKKLGPDEIGLDKKGNQITGKTWVIRKESYFESKTDDLIINKKTTERYEGENAGYIYVMRNPIFPENTFKIGLTTNDSKTRANQLSNTSVPDNFYVMKEWSVKDCKRAEKEIHSLLDRYRIDPRREFFSLDMETITKKVELVINQLNKG